MFVTSITKNKIFLSIAAVAAAILLVLGSTTLSGKSVAAEEKTAQPTKRTLNVVGQGTVKAAPDIAYITLGITTEDKNAKTAQTNNAQAMSKVIETIKAEEIKNDDIKTVDYSIHPKYSYNKETGESKITGYMVNNSVQVTVRDITKTGKIIDLAAQNGVNVSHNISFGLSDYEKYYNEALKKAVEIAKNRAKTIAGTIGVTLDVPVSISENGGYSPVYEYRANYNMKEASVSTPIEAGTITIQANVNMTYEY